MYVNIKKKEHTGKVRKEQMLSKKNKLHPVQKLLSSNIHLPSNQDKHNNRVTMQAKKKQLIILNQRVLMGKLMVLLIKIRAKFKLRMTKISKIKTNTSFHHLQKKRYKIQKNMNKN